MKCSLKIVLLLLPLHSQAKDGHLFIYQDADISSHIESSQAIQKGIELAFDEVGNEVEGYTIGFKYLDHRGNVVRSLGNYQQFIDDPDALVIYSGIHSPPLIKNREFINTNKALSLVPWAAGGPITRYPSSENWVFRLSIDDTQAGPVLIDFALKNKGCKSPHLLLEKTPWGDSNLVSMSDALAKNNIRRASVTRFNWNLQDIGARAILRDIIERNDDCIILVANSAESKVLLAQLNQLPEESRVPVISHWGLTGGNFPEVVKADDRKNLDLHFIQTCFSFTNPLQSEFAKSVFLRLQEFSNGKISSPDSLKAPSGFIHAYDLTRILIQAIRQVGLTGDMSVDRNAVRVALENLRSPVEGLVKTYVSPFSVFDEKTSRNAHEALNAENYCMGKFGPNDEVLILQD